MRCDAMRRRKQPTNAAAAGWVRSAYRLGVGLLHERRQVVDERRVGRRRQLGRCSSRQRRARIAPPALVRFPDAVHDGDGLGLRQRHRLHPLRAPQQGRHAAVRAKRREEARTAARFERKPLRRQKHTVRALHGQFGGRRGAGAAHRDPQRAEHGHALERIAARVQVDVGHELAEHADRQRLALAAARALVGDQLVVPQLQQPQPCRPAAAPSPRARPIASHPWPRTSVQPSQRDNGAGRAGGRYL